MSQLEASAPRGWRNVLRSLRHRNYRLFFIGQTISLVGTWMQSIAMSWLVYRLTGSAWLLGVVGFLNRIPSFILSPLAGVFAERYDRQKLVLWTQILSMFEAVTMTILIFTGWIQVWHIETLAVFIGIVNAFDIPVRQSFYVDMIDDRADLSNAIALNSTMFNLARVLGPALAGILIYQVKEGPCFALNALSYVAVLWALLAMKPVKRAAGAGEVEVWKDLKEGLAYAYGFAPLRAVLTFVSAISFLGMPYAVLMPVIVKITLNGGAQTYGSLMGVSGIGALGGAIYLASRRHVMHLERVIVRASIFFGLAVVALSLSNVLWLSMLSMVALGFGMIAMFASCNTVLQSVCSDEMRGRIMGAYSMALVGVVPMGNLCAGWLAERIGAPHTLLLSGIASIAIAGWFANGLPAFRAIVHPIYVSKGLVPEEAMEESGLG